MLRWRTVTAFILGPIVLGAIMIGPWAIYALILIVIALAAQELSRALDRLPFLAALGAGVAPVLLSIPYGLGGILAGLLLSLPWTLLWVATNPSVRTLRALLAVLLMALWVGAPMSHLGLLSLLPDSVLLVMVVVAGPWISDAGAYFAGRFFGRHLLFPGLSPHKTVEGGIGGVILTILVVAPLAHQFLEFPIWRAVVVGAVISLFSQSGDLFESALKRILELKDFGHLLPGHGGMLDRIDSLLFTAPAVYYVFLFL